MPMLNFTNSFIQNFSNPLLGVTVFENIITEETRKEISEYARHLHANNMMSKNPAGEGRYRKRIDVKDSACVTEIIDNLNDFFKNFNGTPDNKISNILTYNYSGSNIQPHQDDYGATQLRVNIIIEKDELSGNPVINGFLYKIKEKGGWIFSPSSSLHGSTKINNDIRINLSLGWNFVNIEDYINAFVSISTK